MARRGAADHEIIWKAPALQRPARLGDAFQQEFDAAADHLIHGLANGREVVRTPGRQLDVVVTHHPEVLGHPDAQLARTVHRAQRQDIIHAEDGVGPVAEFQQPDRRLSTVGVTECFRAPVVLRRQRYPGPRQCRAKAAFSVANRAGPRNPPDQGDALAAAAQHVLRDALASARVVAGHLVGRIAVDRAVDQHHRGLRRADLLQERRFRGSRHQHHPIDDALAQGARRRLVAPMLGVPDDHAPVLPCELYTGGLQHGGVKLIGQPGHDDPDGTGAAALDRPGGGIRLVLGLGQHAQHPLASLGPHPGVPTQHARDGGLRNAGEARHLVASERTLQTTRLSRSAAICSAVIPSRPPSTSSVCWPSTGGAAPYSMRVRE